LLYTLGRNGKDDAGRNDQDHGGDADDLVIRVPGNP
jgi:hypothetical protein